MLDAALLEGGVFVSEWRLGREAIPVSEGSACRAGLHRSVVYRARFVFILCLVLLLVR